MSHENRKFQTRSATIGDSSSWGTNRPSSCQKQLPRLPRLESENSIDNTQLTASQEAISNDTAICLETNPSFDLTDSYKSFPDIHEMTRREEPNKPSFPHCDDNEFVRIHSTPRDIKRLSKSSSVLYSAPNTDFSPPDDYCYDVRPVSSVLNLCASKSGGSCVRCTKNDKKLRELQYNCDLLKLSNNSLTKQYQAIKRGLDDVDRGGGDSHANKTSKQETSALREEIAGLKSLMEKQTAGWEDASSEKEAINNLRSAILHHMQRMGPFRERQVAHYKTVIAELMRALLEERESNSAFLSRSESRLIEENSRLQAVVTEQEHVEKMLKAHDAQLCEQNLKLKEKINQLKSELGIISGLAPKLSDDDKITIQKPWRNLPASLKDELESGRNISEDMCNRENLSGVEEVVQCLYYRHQITAKSFIELQNELESIGILKEQQLETLKEIDMLLIEKDEEIRKIKDQLIAEQEGKKALMEEYNKKLSDAITEKNNLNLALITLKENEVVSSILQFDEGSESTMRYEDDEQLERVLNELMSMYDIAEVKEENLNLRKQIEELDQQFQVRQSSGLTAAVDQDSEIPNSNNEFYETLQQDIQKLTDRNNALTEENDSLSKKLEEEKSKLQSMETQMHRLSTLDEMETHVEFLKEELRQVGDDRKELRDQMSLLTSQITENSNKQIDILREKDEEIKQSRDQIQSLTCQLQERKGQIDMEKRTIAELRASNQKEIRLQEDNIRRECSQEVTLLKRELDLFQKKYQTNEHEKNRIMEDYKTVARRMKTFEKTIVNSKFICDELLEKINRSTEEDSNRNLEEISSTLTELQHALDTGEFTSDIDSEEDKKISKRFHSATRQSVQPIRRASSASRRSSSVGGYRRQSSLSFSKRPSLIIMEDDEEEDLAIHNNPEIQIAANQTHEMSDDLMRKLQSLESVPSIDHHNLIQGLNDLTAKFEIERNLLRSQLGKSLLDIQSYQTRIEALEESKRSLQIVCDSLESKYESNKTQLSQAKKIQEDYNKLISESEELKQKFNSLTQTLKDSRKKYRADREDIQKKLSTSEKERTDKEKEIEKLTLKREKMIETIKTLEVECAKYKSEIEEFQAATTGERENYEKQLKTTREGLQQSRNEIKVKSKELTDLQDSLMTAHSEQKRLNHELRYTEEKLQSEKDMVVRLTKRNSELEEEISNLTSKLASLQGNKEAASVIEKEMTDLKRQLLQAQNDLAVKDQELQAKEKHLEQHRQGNAELETKLAKERSQHMSAKSRLESMEDEIDWLKKQVAATRRRDGPSMDDRTGKSRAEQINDIIMKSQNRAQDMLNQSGNQMNSHHPEMGFRPIGGPGPISSPLSHIYSNDVDDILSNGKSRTRSINGDFGRN